MADLIDRQQAIDVLEERLQVSGYSNVALVSELNRSIGYLMQLPSAQPERTGRWILDRSGRYCCNRCMEPCAGYVMMRPRDKYCKMCGSRNEVTE